MTSHSPPPFLPQITLYEHWLEHQRGRRFASYDALWHWSTTDLNRFWQSVWDYFELQSPTPHRWCATVRPCRIPNGLWARRSTMRSRCSAM